MKKVFDSGYSVETWFNRDARIWTTQLKDPQGNQIGDADLDGNKIAASLSFRSLCTDRQNQELAEQQTEREPSDEPREY